MKEKSETEKTDTRSFTRGEEISHSISHGVGALLSIAALVLLVIFSVRSGSARITAGYAIFGASLIVLFAVSSIFHGLLAGAAKRAMAVMDYSAIYVLIAGSYTAFSFAALRGPASWALFGAAWGIAVVGITMKLIFPFRYYKAFLVSYLVMGWLVAPFLGRIQATIPAGAFALFLAGGLSYTVGTIAFSLQRFKWLHFVWHLFVLGGAVCHALAAMAIIV
ncbi:MAG: hemolysin III family protein [Treponemataceae bacterium]